MGFDFTADNIFEMAEQIEKNGAAFYSEAAKNVKDESLKKLLQSLQGMELDHEKVFSQMRSSLTQKEKEALIFDPGDEEPAYLRALADTRVFFQKKIDYSSLNDIFIFAISAEKESILFYLGMKDFVPEKMGKNWLDSIIEEEKKHIALLSKLLLDLKKS